MMFLDKNQVHPQKWNSEIVSFWFKARYKYWIWNKLWVLCTPKCLKSLYVCLINFYLLWSYGMTFLSPSGKMNYFPYKQFDLLFNRISLLGKHYGCLFSFLQVLHHSCIIGWSTQKDCLHYKISPYTYIKWIHFLNKIKFDFTKCSLNFLYLSSINQKKSS